MTLLTPEFLQTKTYSALRDRLALAHGGRVQAGVWDANDFKVAQRAAGANMSVDIGAGYALVPADDPGNAGLYHAQNDATINLATFTAANATNPRIDQVVLRVYDTTHGGDVSDTPTVELVTGTATSGATLDNRTGAGTPPTGTLRLADVLIPAASTSVVTANIRDRRPWARGALGYVTAAAALVNTAGATNSEASAMRMRIEGGPNSFYRITATGWVSQTSGTAVDINLMQAGASIRSARVFPPTSGGGMQAFAQWGISGGAGSILWSMGIGNISGVGNAIIGVADGFRLTEFLIQELPMAAANNGTA